MPALLARRKNRGAKKRFTCDEHARRHRHEAVEHRVDTVVVRVDQHGGALHDPGTDALERVGERREDA